MDKKNLIKALNSVAPQYFSFVDSTIDQVTYQSILLFYKNEILTSPNNNFNNWGTFFYGTKQYKKDILFEIGELVYKKRGGTVLWEEIVHKGDSLQLDLERKKHNIHNGISFLLKLDELYTIVLNLSSSKELNASQFYSICIFNKNTLLNKFQELLRFGDLTII